MIDLSNIFAETSMKTAETQSNESVKLTETEEKEQRNIKNSVTQSIESTFEQSIEDDEEGSFEASVDDSSDDGGEDNFDDAMDSVDAMDPVDGGDFGSDDDSGSSEGGTGGGTGSAGGVDDLDLNKGSSLNTFTQVNQKLYHIEELNKLLTSIRNSINRYNDIYTDWSELYPLKKLADVVDEERNSFMMQENPENLIKLRLFQEQYEMIVNNLDVLIKQKAKNKES